MLLEVGVWGRRGNNEEKGVGKVREGRHEGGGGGDERGGSGGGGREEMVIRGEGK